MTGLRQGLRSLLTLDGTPRGIAGGFTLGLVLSLVPVPFAGMFLALALAPVLRLNLPSTYVGTAIVNPLSGVFFYGSELWLGMWLLGRQAPSWDALAALDAWGWFALLQDLLGPFLLGAATLGAAATAFAYPLVHYAVTRWRNLAGPTNDQGADSPKQVDAPL